MIDDLKNEGKIDSSGRFSLDPEKAREKLARYRLGSARAYVLHLAAGAVAAGATRVSFSRSPNAGLKIEHDGRSPQFDQLTQLLEVLSHSPPPPADLRELAIALQALRTLGVERVRLTCPHGCLEMTRQQFIVSPLAASDSVTVTVTTGGFGEKVRRWLNADLPEMQLLADQFLYCEVPLSGPQGQINRFWPLRGPAWSTRATPWPLQHCAVEQRENVTWGWAGFQVAGKSDEAPNLEIVMHGRSYRMSEPRLSSRMLVYSDTPESRPDPGENSEGPSLPADAGRIGVLQALARSISKRRECAHKQFSG